MTSEVIIDAQSKEISIALLEDKRLVEYQREPREASLLGWKHLRGKGQETDAWAERLLCRCRL